MYVMIYELFENSNCAICEIGNTK